MNIAKALKKKNQIAGEIAKLGEIIQRENVQLNSNVSRFNVKDTYTQYKAKVDELVALKAAIAQANSVIWAKIFLIVELKGRISFLRQVNTREGTFREAAVDNVYLPALDTKFVQDETASLEKQIVELQDVIDDYKRYITNLVG
jgi:hypothetical protein